MEIDFTQLIANESDDVIKEMHTYFESVEPTEKSQYTGKYEGYNLSSYHSRKLFAICSS